MRLAEGVTAGDQRSCLHVVHRHAGERFSDVAGGRYRIRLPVGSFGIDVDQAHLHGSERSGQLTVSAVTLVAEPGVLGTPVDLLGLPDVFSAESEAEGLEPHRLQGAVAREHQQVGPRNLLSVLLLHGPKQAPGLVEAGVVRPTVERGETLSTLAATAAAVCNAIGAGSMPAHTHEESAVVPVVGRPPILRRRHQRDDVAL